MDNKEVKSKLSSILTDNKVNLNEKFLEFFITDFQKFSNVNEVYSWSYHQICEKLYNAAVFGINKNDLGNVFDKNINFSEFHEKDVRDVEGDKQKDLFANLTIALSRDNPTLVFNSQEAITYDIDLESHNNGLLPFVCKIIAKKESKSNINIILKQNSVHQLYLLFFEFLLEEDSNINLHFTCENEKSPTSSILNVKVSQKRGSNFNSFLKIDHSDFFKSNIVVELEESQSSVQLLATVNGENESFVDNYTKILHMAPETYSKELYKHLLNDSSTVIFNGSIYVKDDAQKIEAHQRNNSLVLSDSATLHTKPQLEIFADDVKCSHGATVGKIDEEMLFYLQSRGLDEESAKKIIVDAFLLEASMENF